MNPWRGSRYYCPEVPDVTQSPVCNVLWGKSLLIWHLILSLEFAPFFMMLHKNICRSGVLGPGLLDKRALLQFTCLCVPPLYPTRKIYSFDASFWNIVAGNVPVQSIINYSQLSTRYVEKQSLRWTLISTCLNKQEVSQIKTCTNVLNRLGVDRRGYGAKSSAEF